MRPAYREVIDDKDRPFPSRNSAVLDKAWSDPMRQKAEGLETHESRGVGRVDDVEVVFVFSVASKWYVCRMAAVDGDEDRWRVVGSE